jgi:hypothetical protein
MGLASLASQILRDLTECISSREMALVEMLAKCSPAKRISLR